MDAFTLLFHDFLHPPDSLSCASGLGPLVTTGAVTALLPDIGQRGKETPVETALNS